MKLPKKADVEALIGPIDSWFKYYTAMAISAEVSDQPEGTTLFWAAVAGLDQDGKIHNPKKTRVFSVAMEMLSEEALVAAMGGAQALIEGHEEGGDFDTAQTLRAAQGVAQAELAKRQRKWDA